MNVIIRLLLDLFAIRFAKIPKTLSMQEIVNRLCIDICDHITHRSTILDFKLSPK